MNGANGGFLVCIICDCDLMSESHSPNRSRDPCALACGHVFHKGCVDRWLSQKPECPKCRKSISNRDMVDKLYFDKDDNPAESDDESQEENEQPWYEKYESGIAFGVGAAVGVAVVGVLAAVFGGGNKKNERR